MDDEVALTGGNASTGVVRVGETVRKPWLTTSAAIDEFMATVARAGVDVPAALGRDERGRRVVEFVPGRMAMDLPPLGTDELTRVGRMVRAIHDAAEGFTPSAPVTWNVLLPAPDGGTPLICHNDLAPWNLIVGKRWVFIDWDGAGPSTREWDLAYAAQTFALGDPECPAEDAALRLAALIDGYGADSSLRACLPGLMVQRTDAMYTMLRTAHETGIQPWGRMFVTGHGDHWRDATRYLERHLDVWERALGTSSVE